MLTLCSRLFTRTKQEHKVQFPVYHNLFTCVSSWSGSQGALQPVPAGHGGQVASPSQGTQSIHSLYFSSQVNYCVSKSQERGRNPECANITENSPS